MASANYTAAAEGFNKRVQWLVEIDLDRCSLNYTTSPCTASDAGDGSRCYYSFLTCQDPPNYARTTRTYRFCLNEVPWTDTAYAVYPLLKRFTAVPQKVDPSKLFAYPEKVNLSFALDHDPLAPDTDKTLFNTTTAGEFWHNLFARNRNYPGRAVRVLRGFEGLAYADFEQIGPEYKLKSVTYSTTECRVTAESPLAELNKRQIPLSISEDNVLTADINDSATSLTVNDASEFPDPSLFTRNTMYIEIGSEIIAYTTRTTGTNTLSGLTRGAFGTSAAPHTTGDKVAHVCPFGTSSGGADNAMEVIQDLLEWAEIPAADVNTSTFDEVKNGAWPDNDINRVIRKSKKISKLVQELREVRGVIIYIDSGGQFAAAVMSPNESGTTYTDDSFLENSMSVDEDEEDRITRCGLYYDPIEDNASDPDDFSKAVIVINSDLESADNFGDIRDDVILDNWTDPSTSVASVRNLARRVITRRGYGTRVFRFQLEVKDGTLNVGDEINITTRHLLGIDGLAVTRPCLITSKKERGLARIEYEAVDASFNGNYFRIGPSGITEDYDNATEEEKSYGFVGDTDNRVGTQKLTGYIFW